MKRVGLLFVLVLPVFLVCSVNALSYQDSSDVQFTFNSTLSISISDADIVIGNLIPGQDDTSNTVDVVVNTNNLYGYTLTATVGDATKDYRDLRHTNGTTNIASIDVDSDLSTLSGQSSSVWGYTISTDGTTWSNYNGLPKYNDTANTAELRATDGAAADSTTSFKIGAYAEEGQLAGDYTNVINFKVVTNGAPHEPTLQEITTATCPNNATTVVDARDGKEYTIQLFNTEHWNDGPMTLCWMTQNLDLEGGTPLYSDDSNVPDGYPRSGGVPYYTLPESSLNGFAEVDTAYVYNSHSTTCGENSPCYSYYSWPAASAGNLSYVGYDICPKGWRMPTFEEYDSIGYTFVDLFAGENGEVLDGIALSPWNGVYNGNFADDNGWGRNGVFDAGGTYGNLWAAQDAGTKFGTDFSFYEQGYSSSHYWNYCGQGVRCVAK